MKRGEIYKATERSREKGRHYIVFYSPYVGTEFIGAMITHTRSILNIEMNASHFLNQDTNGTEYSVVYDGTRLVRAKLVKFGCWGPFEKVGNLSESGIKFLQENIESLSIETFDEYERRTRRKYKKSKSEKS